MKTVTYHTTDGEDIAVEYDETAPCWVCLEPVVDASGSGTTVCPWCDMGHCRYCRVDMFLMKEEIDGGRSLRKWREHMDWHRNEIDMGKEIVLKKGEVLTD